MRSRNHLTCSLIRCVRGCESSVGYGGISAEDDYHGSSRGAHLRACWYGATKSLKARSTGGQAIEDLDDTMSLMN